MGHQEAIILDTTKSDGIATKLMDSSKMHQLGWKHQVELVQGIEKTYDWFLANVESVKKITL